MKEDSNVLHGSVANRSVGPIECYCYHIVTDTQWPYLIYRMVQILVFFNTLNSIYFHTPYLCSISIDSNAQSMQNRCIF